MEKIKLIIKKPWNFIFKTEQGLYLVFGGLTTLVSLIAFYITFSLCKAAFDVELKDLSTVIKNVAGIVFAYFTNRIFVFKSKNVTKKAKSQEAVLFTVTRIATLLIDIWLLNILIDKAGINVYIGTVITSIVVIILNYIASKLYIFKRKD